MFGAALAILKDERELRLHFDFDVLMAVEDLADKPIDEVLAEMAGPVNPATGKAAFRHPRLKTQVHLFYGATRTHHAELALAECKALLAANNAEILWPMLSALARAMGKGEEIDQAEEGGDGEAADHPPQSAPGIGESSSSDGAQPVSTPTVSDGKRRPATQEP
jgi:hypothetical protein